MPEAISLDFVGLIVSALLTIMVLSYLIGDNPLFRVATHIFVGVAAGYAGAVAWDSVIRPNIVSPIITNGLGGLLDLDLLIPLVLIVMLLFKLSPVTAKLGSLPMAVLVGVGAAVVVGGAITGTLIPQSRAAMLSFRMPESPVDLGASPLEHILNVLILLLGTVSSLVYFQFSSLPSKISSEPAERTLAILRTTGRVFIAVAFGAMYAGALMAAIIALAERFQFLGGFVTDLLGSF
jgi:hypothetical protein